MSTGAHDTSHHTGVDEFDVLSSLGGQFCDVVLAAPLLDISVQIDADHLTPVEDSPICIARHGNFAFSNMSGLAVPHPAKEKTSQPGMSAL